MFVRFRQTTLSFLFLFQIISQGSSSGSSDETIYQGLISGNRSILAIGKLAHSSQLVLLAGQITKPDDIYVFVLDQTTSTGSGKLPLSGGGLLRTKWPALALKLTNVSALFFASDFGYDYLVVLTSDAKAFAYNIEQDQVDELSVSFTSNRPMITSMDELCNYSFEDSKLTRFIYLNSGTSPKVLLPQTDQIIILKSSRLCSISDNVVAVPSDVDCIDGSSDVNWNIQTGFVDSQRITLFDLDGNAYIFSKSSLDHRIPVLLIRSNLTDYLSSPGLAAKTVVFNDGSKGALYYLKLLALVCSFPFGMIICYVICFRRCPPCCSQRGARGRAADMSSGGRTVGSKVTRSSRQLPMVYNATASTTSTRQ